MSETGVLECVNCGFQREFPASKIGKTGNCPTCGEIVRVESSQSQNSKIDIQDEQPRNIGNDEKIQKYAHLDYDPEEEAQKIKAQKEKLKKFLNFGPSGLVHIFKRWMVFVAYLTWAMATILLGHFLRNLGFDSGYIISFVVATIFVVFSFGLLLMMVEMSDDIKKNREQTEKIALHLERLVSLQENEHT